MHPSLRLRLALWYAGLLAIILAFTSLISYSYHSAAHYEDMDRSLVSTAIHVLAELRGRSTAEIQSNPHLPPVNEFASPDVFVRLFDPAGNLLVASPNADQRPQVHPSTVIARNAPLQEGLLGRLMGQLVSVGRPTTATDGGFATTSGPTGQDRFRLYAVEIRQDSSVIGYVEAGVPLEQLDRSMERLRLLLMVMSVVGLVIAIFGGWAIAARALLPVATIASTARAIALSRGFSQRLPDIGRQDELGQLAETFNEMLASLDEAFRTQQRFVADASHELRTPLTTIQGNLELLQRAALLPDDERTEMVAQLRHEAERMGRLVSDLLLLAHADAGQKLRTTRVELDRLLLDVFGAGQLMAHGHKLSIVEIDSLQVDGDPDRLKQLLLILIDNALKYTPRSGEVRLGLRREHGRAVISVDDTGMGIAQEDLPHIFQRFYRADKARTREGGGSGLGLSIAQWIAERHGGQISVESAPGRGSTFSLFLPLPRA